MDFFPDLGEPGIFDELFYFGPLILQLLLGAFFYWLTGRWIKTAGLGIRFLISVGMTLAADLLLFFAFGVVFKLANPTLVDQSKKSTEQAVVGNRDNVSSSLRSGQSSARLPTL